MSGEKQPVKHQTLLLNEKNISTAIKASFYFIIEGTLG